MLRVARDRLLELCALAGGDGSDERPMDGDRIRIVTIQRQVVEPALRSSRSVRYTL